MDLQKFYRLKEAIPVLCTCKRTIFYILRQCWSINMYETGGGEVMHKYVVQVQPCWIGIIAFCLGRYKQMFKCRQTSLDEFPPAALAYWWIVPRHEETRVALYTLLSTEIILSTYQMYLVLFPSWSSLHVPQYANNVIPLRLIFTTCPCMPHNVTLLIITTCFPPNPLTFLIF